MGTYAVKIEDCVNACQREGCYWQTVPPQWGGGKLFAGSEGLPHENGRSSETKSRKINPKVPNLQETDFRVENRKVWHGTTSKIDYIVSLLESQTKVYVCSGQIKMQKEEKTTTK